MASTRNFAHAYAFRVYIPGVTNSVASGFSSVSGLSEEIAVERYVRVNDMDTVLKVPGRHEPQDVTFSRGMAELRSRDSLSKWYEEARGVARGRYNLYEVWKDVMVEWFDRSNAKRVRRADLKQAWPTRLEFGGLDATQSNIVLEAMTLVASEIIWS